jgi:hypothetical protein
LQAEKNGIGAEFGAETTIGELIVGLAGFFRAGWIAQLRFLVAATFEDTQDVAGLGDFPAIERIEFRDDPLRAGFLGSGWRDCFE